MNVRGCAKFGLTPHGGAGILPTVFHEAGRVVEAPGHVHQAGITMKDTMFEIGAEGVDVEAIVADIRARVDAQMREGRYDDALVAQAELTNMSQLKDDDEFLSFYLRSLRDAVFVDISDFDILEKRRRFSRVLVGLKRLIWSLLKFYTYRLWSQQNQVNGLLVTAMESMDEKYAGRIAKLEERIAELEQRLEQRTS